MTGARLGRPPKVAPVVDADVTVRCTVGNLWTSRGKVLRGENITLPESEANLYDDQDKVKSMRNKS